ncbi:uncharacterized protein EKO05_0002860 [Ascochyta rabiei]|uniref:Uncharacterized protein n=1 Tax=Didymella rabiei TaxID=5454 RepID=A0A163L0W1_DIDRA|nr:uncharacterized protein EKO05_0002860 [Ascochyta rabiei]KZM27411.1 hypothetical protein ST47_g1454 [Ascochyta rabiei]UPX12306.1 hypothetical protein EKO05_0002860 [Ascochyta rabiei]
MDPGLGLVVNSMVPNENEPPRPPPKPPLQLPKGFLEKSHVRHALKYMPDDEQRERTLEVALAWKKKFAARKWKTVVAAIEAASKEDCVRSLHHDANMHEPHTILQPTGRPRAMTTASAPAVPRIASPPTSGHSELTSLQTETASLPLRRSLAPSTPRTYRWDLMPTGPVTPLSPTPMGNAFSGGGFWENSAPHTEQHKTPTSTAVVKYVPVSQVVLADTDAREVYVRIKCEIEALARKYCLARYHMHSSLDENDFVPVNMIISRDRKAAADVTLHCRLLKLKKAIVKDLPEKLQSHAMREAALQRQLSIKDEAELYEQNNWMNDEIFATIPKNLGSKHYKAPAHLAVSILDEQREVIRMLRKQRRTDLELPDIAIEAAWAAQISPLKLHGAKAAGSSSGSDDDDGYSYGNFLRSIKSEMSTSSSSGALASMVEELSNSDLISPRSRANTQQTVSSTRSYDFRFPQRSSTSSTKENHSTTRSSGASVSDSSHKHVHSLHQRTDLRVSTEIIDEVPSAELSPEDREFRHRGPNLVDLDHWAEELKRMEAMRADRQNNLALHRRSQDRSTHEGTPEKRMSVDGINTRISPTRHFHSRFSSSSSISTNTSKPLPRSTLTSLSPSRTQSAPKLTMLSHPHHQCNKSGASTSTHRHHTSKASIDDSRRRYQHVRSTSSVHILAKSSSKDDEDAWMRELKNMESREHVRQSCERRRTSQLPKGEGGWRGCYGEEEEEVTDNLAGGKA